MALFEPVIKALNDVQVRCVVVGGLSIPDLIAMKRRSGPPLDLDDIRQLEIIERSRKDGRDE
jgi:hypothetical protein